MLPVSIPDLEQKLPDFLIKQRWYRAKAKNILGVHVFDVIETARDKWLVISQLQYQEGDTAHYLLPFSSSGTERPVIGELRDGLHDSSFRQILLDAIACNRVFMGQKGEFSAARTDAFEADCGSPEQLESSVSRAEQSNSSIVFGQHYILKLFRKLEHGINPDIEIGRFLTANGFRNTPAVLGSLEYRLQQGEAMQAGILMQFVTNRGDAWKYTLESLAGFFERVKGDAPQLANSHPLELNADQSTIAEVGEYIESARLLGRRTAEMHRALNTPGGGPDFDSEPFDPQYARQLNQEMLSQADITFDLLRDKQPMLSGDAAADAEHLIEFESEIRARLSELHTSNPTAVRIRHHGDYHLGQVLWTGSDFMIIDFEGEPARPLADRRIKTFAMRDVAGMVRSFSYAGHAAIPATTEDRKRMEQWGEFWGAIVSSVYLQAYFDAARDSSFVGNSQTENKLLFDAFLLQKALYEVAYELNNRPDWVRIPLHGILNLIGNHGRRTQFA